MTNIDHLFSDEHTHEISGGKRVFNVPEFDKNTYQDVIIFELLVRLECNKESFIDSEMVFKTKSARDQERIIRMLKRSINDQMQNEYDNLSYVDEVFWEIVCSELKFITEVDEYIKFKLISFKRETSKKPTYSHRIKALAYLTQTKAHKEIKLLTRQEMREKGGKNLEKAFDSLTTYSKTYREPNQNEITKAIEILSNDPEAQSLLKTKLAKID